VISVAILTAMTTIFQLIPVVYAYQSQDCKCDHWYINDENTVDDIFTATGLTGHWGGYLFDYVDAWFSAGSGGTYDPKPSAPMYCLRKVQDSNYNWYGPNYYYYYGDWDEDYDIPGGEYFEYAQYRDYQYRYYYDGTYLVRRFSGMTQNWFQNPNNPSSWWLCGSTYATVLV